MTNDSHGVTNDNNNIF